MPSPSSLPSRFLPPPGSFLRRSELLLVRRTCPPAVAPWLDLAGDGESHRTRSSHDPWFTPEKMPALVANFCDPTQVYEPLVSPVHADVTGFPPTFIQVGDHEILLSDSIRLADNIRASDGRVDLHVWPDMWHVFQYFIGQMPESRKAIEDIGRFLRLEFPTATVS